MTLSLELFLSRSMQMTYRTVQTKKQPVKTLLLSFTLLLTFNKMHAQTYDSIGRSNKNLIYGGVGFGGLYFPAFVFYERQLQDHFLNTKFSSFVTVGTGAAAHWEGASTFATAKFGLLLGQQKAHLETAIGVNYFYKGDFTGTLPLAASIGYRANEPGKNYVFRTGVAWPEAIYVSWGFRF